MKALLVLVLVLPNVLAKPILSPVNHRAPQYHQRALASNSDEYRSDPFEMEVENDAYELRDRRPFKAHHVKAHEVKTNDDEEFTPAIAACAHQIFELVREKRCEIGELTGSSCNRPPVMPLYEEYCCKPFGRIVPGIQENCRK